MQDLKQRKRRACQTEKYKKHSLQSRCMFFSFFEKSTTTSSSLKRAAKDPSTILGVSGEFGPMLASRREVPKDSFFSLISEHRF